MTETMMMMMMMMTDADDISVMTSLCVSVCRHVTVSRPAVTRCLDSASVHPAGLDSDVKTVSLFTISHSSVIVSTYM